MKRQQLLDKVSRAANMGRLRAESQYRDAAQKRQTLQKSIEKIEASIRREVSYMETCLPTGYYSKEDYADGLGRQAQALHALAALRLALENLLDERAYAEERFCEAEWAMRNAMAKDERIDRERRAATQSQRNAVERIEIEDIVEVKCHVLQD
ncbi:hypothetical protein WM40_19365 [Robbsia andropogonis]|uniref:Flagellar FliJ protein n=1 Tax=Robbsia andropogonis TaxID=28092 RepID=A0A0F5JWR9_9BURK|nr:hypothetical protein [Robbsia andropogonis]KKB62064.1 hypothetical protein WM40_19365 [Robbsia andropogonis]MCP1117395.1 hypothetical protein [Robbsia andropogonis]MCP1126861.1 hypothetical protein [Robbsia andropogonis]